MRITNVDRIGIRMFVDDSSMSHGFCHFHRRRKFNALSSVRSPLHLSLQSTSDRSIFADAARSAGLTLGLTSFTPRAEEASGEQPEESVSPSMGSMIDAVGTVGISRRTLREKRVPSSLEEKIIAVNLWNL